MATNSSDSVSSGVFFHLRDNRLLHLLAIFPQNFNLAECYYEIHDTKWSPTISCFKQWKLELEEIRVPVTVITDYKNLQYSITTKKLTRPQACWAKFLSKFNFVIFYIPNKENQKADLLTRRKNNFLFNNNNDYQQYLL